MKRDIANFVLKCLTCQQVEAEHKKPPGLLMSLPTPECKWSHITIDFVTEFPQSPHGHDPIWVVMDRLMKPAHFLPIQMNYTMERLAQIYLRKIVRINGVPETIVSDRDPRFLLRF